ncbi:MAG: T9SS type A sorting domain-containing protein [Flavobacteriales bacterium]|nr:T9SS type A sorting domain-containing protein [Flavobacteriales bacterium]
MTKSISILIVISGLLISKTSHAQQVYFNNRYDFNGSQEVIWSVLETDSGYLCAAGVGAGEILLLSLDTLGNTVEEKPYGKTGGTLFPGLSGSLIKTADGGFALGGSIDLGNVSNAMLWRFDKNLDTVWTKTYGTPIYSQIGYQCKQTPDGGFVIIGVTDQFVGNDILLIKTDSLGDQQWQRAYGGSATESGLSINLTLDNGYILGGSTKSFGAGGADMYVIKVDSLGNQQWDTTFGGIYDDGAARVMQASDGGYLIGGAIGQYILSSSFTQRQPLIVKLNSQGVIEWEKGYGPARYLTSTLSIHEQSDGSFVAAGQSNNSRGIVAGSGWAIGFILKVTGQGDSVWYREHEYDTCYKNDDFLRDMKPTNDGGFVTAGFFGPRTAPPCNDTGSQDMWVLKLDSCGCAYAGCDSACQQLVGVEELQDDEAKILIYPNPFSSQATVQFDRLTTDAELMIYDVTGRLVSKYAIRKNLNSLTLVGKEIGTGIFFLQLSQEHSVIASQKVIINK